MLALSGAGSLLLLAAKVNKLLLLLVYHFLHVHRHDAEANLLCVHLNELLVKELAVFDLGHVKWLQLFFKQLFNIEAFEELVVEHFLQSVLSESLGFLFR